MIFNQFDFQQPVASIQMPLTLINLDDWVLIHVNGSDSQKYLQSQLTADISQIPINHHILTAHCNSKGKILSNFCLFRQNNGFSFIERRSVCNVQLTELKRYAIFSNVTFTINDEFTLLGIAGFHARKSLKNLFKELPNSEKSLVNYEATSLLWFKFPLERFLIICNKIMAQHIIKVIEDNNQVQFKGSQQWLSLHIEAGIPIIDYINIGRFTPQEINLQELGAISFNKGCYIGQEAIAKAKFLGIKKRALWYLTGISNHIPKIGESLEMKIGKNWKKTGTVLAAVQLNNGRLLIQAVINNNLEPNCMFRVQNDINTLSIQPLPYL